MQGIALFKPAIGSVGWGDGVNNNFTIIEDAFNGVRKIGPLDVTEKVDIDGFVAIKDGQGIPDPITDRAIIFVDSLDGDLKVKFSDGTVKTIDLSP